MARIITIANNKGGCGKTTTAVNFAAGLRNAGRNVLCIDVDAQCNLTACFGLRPGAPSTFDALKAPRAPYIAPVRVLDAVEGAGVLDVLPAVPDLSAVELSLAGEADRLQRFARFVEQYRPRYDFVIIDTPPAVGVLTIGALYASDETIITTQPQFLAVQGLIKLRDVIGKLNTAGAAIGSARVLFTQYDRRKGLHRETVARVEAAGFDVFDAKIRENVALGEAPAAGIDIFRYAPKSNGAADYGAMLAEYQRNNRITHKTKKQ